MNSNYRQSLIAFAILAFAISLAGTNAQPSPGTKLWEINLSEDFQTYASPVAVAADGSIYVCDARALFAIDSQGNLRWQADLGGVLSTTVALAPSGHIYCVGKIPGSNPSSLRVRCFNPDGTTSWVLSIEDAVLSGNCAVAHNGDLILPVHNEQSGAKPRIAAFSRSGIKKWELPLPKDAESTHGISIGQDGTIYAAVGSLLALRPDGSVIWKSPNLNMRGSAPTLSDRGEVIVINANGAMIAFAENGLQLWQGVPGGWPGCLNADGSIFTAMRGNFLGFADVVGILHYDSNGIELRRFGASVRGLNFMEAIPLAVAMDGSIYARGFRYGQERYLYCLDRSGGVAWLSGGEDPCFGGDGTVYLKTRSNRGFSLSAFKGSSPLANSSWPMVNGGPDRSYRAGPYHGLPARPLLNAVRWRFDRGFQFTSVTPVGSSYSVEATSDFVTWQKVLEILHDRPVMHLTEALATNQAMRFYRVKVRE